jgi:hypothetical protein
MELKDQTGEAGAYPGAAAEVLFNIYGVGAFPRDYVITCWCVLCQMNCEEI